MVYLLNMVIFNSYVKLPEGSYPPKKYHYPRVRSCMSRRGELVWCQLIPGLSHQNIRVERAGRPSQPSHHEWESRAIPAIYQVCHCVYRKGLYLQNTHLVPGPKYLLKLGFLWLKIWYNTYQYLYLLNSDPSHKSLWIDDLPCRHGSPGWNNQRWYQLDYIKS